MGSGQRTSPCRRESAVVVTITVRKDGWKTKFNETFGTLHANPDTLKDLVVPTGGREDEYEDEGMEPCHIWFGSLRSIAL